MNQEKISIGLGYPWDENGYCPEVEFNPCMTETGFRMRIFIGRSILANCYSANKAKEEEP